MRSPTDTQPSAQPDAPAPAPTLLPGVRAENDPARDVHVAKSSKLRWRRQRRRWMREHQITSRVGALQPPAVVGVGLFMVLGSILGNAVASAWGLRTGWTGLAGAALGIPAGLLAWRALRRIRARGPAADVAPATDERYRLRAVGDGSQIGAVGMLSDDPFEPQVYFVPFAHADAPAVSILLAVALTAAFALLLLVLRRQGLLPTLAGAGPLQAWDIWACMAVAVVPLYALFPTYYRIAPGRLDVFRYRMLGLGRPRVQTYDLRRASLLADVRNAFFVVEPAGGEGRLLFMVGHWGGRMPEVTRYLLQAARWRHETPALSTDSLSG